MPDSKDSKDNYPDIPHTRTEPRPDFSKHLDKSKLPEAIQKTLDDDESMWKVLYDGKGSDSTSTDYRYAAYASRVRTILLSAHRYVAYTSDIGESFRPIAHPYLIRSAYGISWAYLIGDVSHEGYKAYVRNQQILNPQGHADVQKQLPESMPASDGQKSAAPGQSIAATAVSAAKDLAAATPTHIAPVDDYRTVMAQRAIFQGLASMGLPAFTIHSIVKYSGKALKDASNKTIRTWGPIGLGLAAVPALPYMFDEPVEHAVEYVFHKGFAMAGMGGTTHGKEKEKEL